MKTLPSIHLLKMLNMPLALSLFILLLLTFSSCATGKKAKASEAGTATPDAQGTPAVKKTDASGEEIPFVVVEEMPVFPGGDSMLLDYIAKNTRYPETARTKKIEGRVILRFCVTETGSVNKISILKGVDPDIDAEAMRVVETLPRFIPGRQSGRDVPVWYMVPVTFALK
jgi:TonB family protein